MEPDSRTSITLQTTQHIFLVAPETIERMAQLICAGLGVANYELSWSFLTAQEMRALNREFRGKDNSTDVLSFPQQEWSQPLHFSPAEYVMTPGTEQGSQDAPQLLGDVVISPEDALRNAEDIGHTLDRELAFLLVHGILHLCGHDHNETSEEARMIAEQKAIMSFLETLDVKPVWTDCIRMKG